MAHAMVMLPAPSMRAFRDSWLRALRAGLAD